MTISHLHLWSLTLLVTLGICRSVAAHDMDANALDFHVPTEQNDSDAANDAASTDHSIETNHGAEMPQATVTDRGLREPMGHKSYQAGARLRWVFFPKFFLFGQVDLRAQKIPRPLVSSVGVGAEFIYRRKLTDTLGLDITPAIWWVDISWDGTISFKGKGEDDNSWETVTNSMSTLLFSVDIVRSTDIVDWFAITWGEGVGMGIPIGELVRTEASASSNGYEPCLPEQIGRDAWCNFGEEYDEVYQKFPIPWVNFLLGTRFKPHKHLAIHVDGGFGIGFQLGARLGYIF